MKIFSSYLAIAACIPTLRAFPRSTIQIQLNTGDNAPSIGIPEALFDNFKLFASFTAASYCPGHENATSDTLIACPSNDYALVEADAAISMINFGGSDATTPVDIKGYVTLDTKRSLIVVAFAGSGATLRNWIADFEFLRVPYDIAGCSSCWIHSGFSTGWSERRSFVLSAVESAKSSHPDYTLIITGHSIGAAVATLAAAELRSLDYSADLYTYGSPRVGNVAFAEFVTAQAQSLGLGMNYRMTHVNDPVPQLSPTWIGYEHLSPEFWLSNGTATTDAYGAQDIVVCEGIGNEDCNGGTGLIPLDAEAHSHYLGTIDACVARFSI